MLGTNRYRTFGQILHITHRCYKNEFLLKFARDRKRWLYWLYEAKRRYKLTILNYVVTSNHIHLLAKDSGKGEIANSMQLIAGRTAQEYNQRKKRKGAYWEDRYQSTAIEPGDHFTKCLVYIDLNMVRAGVVSHPQHWPFNGYNEILSPPKRYSLIRINMLKHLCGIYDPFLFKETYRQWVEAELKLNTKERQGKWTENLAVGSKDFVEKYIQSFGQSKRRIEKTNRDDKIREANNAYSIDFTSKMDTLRHDNSHCWMEIN
ncbi:MAG: transposase [Gammaproteobacteria bacterium]|nr:transposase [Gammaproteobacteria bacterium]